MVVEVNVSGEATKHGCAPSDVAALIDAVEASARLGIPDRSLDLSMGMSRNLEWAIAEGAMIVRLGTAIFGARRA